MSNPVSLLTLEGIPWMSAKSLAHAMREVSLRGPNDLTTWTRLVGRADMIAHSLNPKQTALVIHSLGKVVADEKFSSTEFVETFINRYTRKFLPQILPYTSALDAAQILHGLLVLGKSNKRLVQSLPMMIDRVTSLAQDMDLKSISMCAASLSDEKLPLPSEIRMKSIVALLTRFIQFEEVNEQSLAQIFRASATCAAQRDDVIRRVEDICVKHLGMIETMSVRSLSVVLNSLAKIQKCRAPIVNEILMTVSERIRNGDRGLSSGASLLQLAVILRSIQKLGMREVCPIADQSIVEYIRSRDLSKMSNHTMCVLLSALVHVPGIQSLIKSVVETCRSSGSQLTQSELLVVTNVLRNSGFDPDYTDTIILVISGRINRNAEM